jgi:hypothetical protein
MKIVAVKTDKMIKQYNEKMKKKINKGMFWYNGRYSSNLVFSS